MKILAIDGNSIINRAFYGIRLLSTRDGVYTNAVYGFLSTYFKVVEEEKPDGVCVCFDLPAPTFRHFEFGDYKAGRRPMPDELVPQIPLMKEILDAMGIPRCEQAGFEADDLLGAASRVCSRGGCECVILTGDRDSLQLANEYTKIKLITTRDGKPLSVDYTPEYIMETYGVEPPRLIDVKALMGDKSDNIPGVAGVGEKTALSLIAKYGDLDSVYAHLDELRGSVREKLERDRDNAYMSRRLAEIDTSSPFCFSVEDMRPRETDRAALYSLFSRLELRSFISKLGLSPGQASAPAAAVSETRYDVVVPESIDALRRVLDGECCLAFDDTLSELALLSGDTVYRVSADRFGNAWNAVVSEIMSERVKKCVHDLKPLLLMLMERNIPFGGFVFDTAAAAYIVNPSFNSYSLNTLCEKYLGNTRIEGIEREVSYVFRLVSILRGELEKASAVSLFETIELPLCEVLAYLQYVGFRIDSAALSDYGVELSRQATETECEIYEKAGTVFNINSPKQLGEVLFETLGLPCGKKTKTGYSTDVAVLGRLAELHPVPALVIEYRSLTKLKSTYCDGLLRQLAPDGRVHGTFNQFSTVTGRISSSEPNLQNIPVRQERGAQLRAMFIPENNDYVLADADYSQIELRILACVANDGNMIDTFLNGGDIHRDTAAKICRIDPRDVTPEQRNRAKAVNFGLVYGISDFALSQSLKIPRWEAKEYIDSYFSLYPGVKKYMDDIRASAKEKGYVTTLFGRRRYLPELSSSNHNIRSFGERAALNTPIQGTAADIIKLAMVNVYKRLKREGLRSRLILQVHDELIVEARRDESEYIVRLLREEMEGACALTVPLTAQAHTGRNWLEAK